MILSSSTQFELGCEMPKLNKDAGASIHKFALFLCPQYHSMVGVFWGALRSPFLFVYGISTQLTSATQCLRSLVGGLLYKQRSHIMLNALRREKIAHQYITKCSSIILRGAAS